MTNAIAFVSIKGGVGKTTLAIETASSLVNKFGKSVLLVDANFSAPNIGLYFNIDGDVTLHDALLGIGLHNAIYEAYGIDIVPASLYYDGGVDVFRLKKILDKFKKRYDYIIIDSSPNYDELKPVVAAADKIFIVTSPDEVTLLTSLKAARLAREQRTPIEGLIVNRIRSPRHEYSLREIEEISEIPVLARVKDNKKIAEALKLRKPLTIHDRKNPISKEIHRFASAICGEKEEDGFFWRFNPLRKVFQKERVNREYYRSQL